METPYQTIIIEFSLLTLQLIYNLTYGPDFLGAYPFRVSLSVPGTCCQTFNANFLDNPKSGDVGLVMITQWPDNSRSFCRVHSTIYMRLLFDRVEFLKFSVGFLLAQRRASLALCVPFVYYYFVLRKGALEGLWISSCVWVCLFAGSRSCGTCSTATRNTHCNLPTVQRQKNNAAASQLDLFEIGTLAARAAFFSVPGGVTFFIRLL